MINLNGRGDWKGFYRIDSDGTRSTLALSFRFLLPWCHSEGFTGGPAVRLVL